MSLVETFIALSPRPMFGIITDNMDYKDLFSAQSPDYARFRPTYPPALFDYLAGVAPDRKLAWDCGTGNGQAAIELAQRFEAVIATDPSAKQLESAVAHPKVRYAAGSASASPLADHSCNLVTAAQAFHWFDPEAFYREARRVLVPGGLVAIWSYNLCEITPEVDQQVHALYDDVLGPYWEPERRQVEQGYAHATFPFKELAPPPFAMEREWTLEHLLGYLGTWSALQAYLKKNPGDLPLERLAPRFIKAWGASRPRVVRWKIALRVGQS